MTPISAEILVSKMVAVQNGDYPRIAEQLAATPRLEEALWFIQWKSRQPGGLMKLAADLALSHDDRMGFKIIWEYGYPFDDKWTMDQCLTVWKAMLAIKPLPTLFSDFAAFANT